MGRFQGRRSPIRATWGVQDAAGELSVDDGGSGPGTPVVFVHSAAGDAMFLATVP